MVKVNIELSMNKKFNFFSRLQESSRDNVTKKIRNEFNTFERFLNTYGLEFNRIEIVPLNQRDLAFYSLDIVQKIEKAQRDSLCSKFMQEARLSRRTYANAVKTMKKLGFQMSSVSKTTSYQKKISRFFKMHQNSMGSYVECRKKIEFVLKKIYGNHKKEIANDTFILELSGDGTMVTKTGLQLLNFTFNCINANDSSFNGHYILGIFKIKKENYESIIIALEELVSEIEAITTIKIEDKELKIKYIIGGDYKWQSTISGIGASNSNYSCKWCKWNSKDEINIEDEWSISDRSHEEAKELMKKTKIDEKCGYKREAIFKYIAFEDSVPDPLHMVLRITDQLINRLVSHINTKDNNSSIDYDKRPLLRSLKDFFEIDCSITCPFYTKEKDNNKSKIKLRSLNKNARIRILEELFKNGNLLDIFPTGFETDSVFDTFNFLLKEYYDLYKLISDDYSKKDFDKENLKEKLKKWLSFYLTISKNITPYIHIFVFHVPEFVSKHKNLNQFTMQGLEKLNDEIKKDFFRRTNRHKTKFTSQLLELANHREFNSLNGKISELYE